MSSKRKLPSCNSTSKTPRLEDDEHADYVQSSIPLCNDTEAAMLFIKNILSSKNNPNLRVFPPVVFVHQISNIIESKTTVNRQIVCNLCALSYRVS